MMLSLLLSSVAMASELNDAIVLELSKRHALDCEAVFALGESTAVRGALLQIAEKVEAPPWAPMHAASCVLPLAVGDESSMSVIKGWFSSVETSGLALVVTQQLDRIDEQTAVLLADEAMELATRDSRFALYAKRALSASKHPMVVQRVQPEK